MEVHDKIAEIVALVDSARTMPMSSTAMVNKQQVLALLDEVREGLPANLQAAEAVLGQREALLIEARGNAERILANARSEQARLVADHTVTQAARVEAEDIVQQAREQAENIRSDADDYVDAKLARLEIAAARIVETVRDGREQLRHPTAYGELSQRRNGNPVVVPQLDGTADLAEEFSSGSDGKAERFGPDADESDDEPRAAGRDSQPDKLTSGLG
ncbi:hypothetical protein [Jiangella anatolica]|uniref:ATPase n=1 Tax=Jiangella anatolica TaxID=2670374 RepID=A0A2W2BD82_9ACTN|nr:hypothetical protein [Jiangella anatolica]PZF83270.1 hypothetical protein C1I92_13430 [Jiangella anatolica]